MESLHVVREERFETEETRALHDAINRFNVVTTGRTEFVPVVFLLRDEADTVRGGLVGYLWGDWLHIDVLWVDEDLRRQGHGSRLLEAAEAVAIEHGCRAVCLETFSFQAPAFYPRFGYELFGILDDYPPGHRKLFYRKRLDPEP